MGKNKQKRNQNKFVIGDSDDDITNTNLKNTDLKNTEPRKKNMFENLSDDFSDQVNKTETFIEKNRDDYYFSQGYHFDDYENDYENAIKFYKLSIEHDSDYYKSVASYNIALIYSDKLSNDSEAEKYYKIACEKNYTDAFHNLGMLYFNQKKYPEAIYYLEKSIKSGDTDVYYECAICYEKTGDNLKAMQYLQYHLMLKNANLNEKKLWKKLNNLFFI